MVISGSADQILTISLVSYEARRPELTCEIFFSSNIEKKGSSQWKMHFWNWKVKIVNIQLKLVMHYTYKIYILLKK